METKDQTNTDGVVLQNAVVRVQWKRKGTDEDTGLSHTFLASSNFSAEDVPEANFTNYFSLTQDQVVGWIENKLGAHEVAKIDDIINSRIEKKNTIVRTPPWS